MSQRHSNLRDEEIESLLSPSSAPPTSLLILPQLPQKKLGFILGLLFCILFLAFNATQNLQSTLNKTLGFWSLAILYVVFATSNFFAPAIVMQIGEKWAIMLGAVGYVAYIAANVYVLTPTLLISAALNGFGAAILWTAQGSYLMKCSTKETQGTLSGIFFAIFQLNQIIGNLMVALILDRLSLSRTYLFIIFTAVGCFSVVSFLFLKNPTAFEYMETKKLTTSQRIVETFKVFTEARMILFTTIIVFSGLSQSFFYGRFPKTLGEELIKWIGYVMACFGAADTLGSYAFGKLADYIGRKLVMFMSGVLFLTATVMLLLFSNEFLKHHIYFYFIIGILLGFSDAGFYTCLYATIAALFQDRLEIGFAAFRFVQALSTAIFFFVSPYLDLQFSILVVSSFLILGYLNYFFLDLCVASVEGDKEQTSSNQQRREKDSVNQ